MRWLLESGFFRIMPLSEDSDGDSCQLGVLNRGSSCGSGRDQAQARSYVRRVPMLAHERPWRFVVILAAALAICFCSMAQARQGNDEAGEEQDRQGKTTTFAAAIDAMVQECREQAVDLKGMPLDFVGQAVQLHDEQGSQLEQVRSAGRAVAEALDANCPKDVGVQLSKKIAVLDHALQVMADSLNSLHPVLAS